ncbi:MAG: hypothetical protein WC979_05300 [Candidatus Pacearchaeota archaeon]|jgi:hypothetical protein
MCDTKFICSVAFCPNCKLLYVFNENNEQGKELVLSEEIKEELVQKLFA